jgi:purine-binding chemotaxis protein CheW
MRSDVGELWLVFYAGAHLCALRLEHVVEIMRPLAVEPLAGAPSFVAGVCVIRGEPAPVVDVASLVGGGVRTATRYITVKCGAPPERPGETAAGEPGGRQCSVALAVDSVLGVRHIESDSLHDLPPLLGARNRELIGRLGVVGTEPLLFLRRAGLESGAALAALDPEPVLQ